MTGEGEQDKELRESGAPSKLLSSSEAIPDGT